MKNIKSPFNEACELISAELSVNGTVFSVIEYYRPLVTSDSQFYATLDSHLVDLEKYKISILCTDQNYNLLKSHVHKPTRDYLEVLLSSSYAPCINLLMRITHSTCTLIDNVYVKCRPLLNNYSYVVVDGMSDHYPCMVSLLLDRKVKAEKTIIHRHKLSDDLIAKIYCSMSGHQ